MHTPPDEPCEGDTGNHRWPSRLLWFVGLWLAGVGTVTVLSYGIRAMIMP